MPERVLITGAGGFVGKWMTEEIAAAWEGAALFGTTTTESAQTDASASITLIPCDITDAVAVEQAVRTARPTAVVHLAGMASGAGTDSERLNAVNATATVTLLEAVAALGEPCRVLLASSGYVYGATQPGRPARENDPLNASGAYAESKAEMERIVAEWARGQVDSPVSVIVARAFNHTGPRQNESFVVPAFARQIARIEADLEPAVVRVGNLSARRDFLHVADVVRAYRLLLEGSEQREPILTVNVASGEARSVRSVLDELVALAGVPVDIQVDQARMRPVDLEECVGDPSKLMSLTGWTIDHTLSQTLADTLGWWRKQVV